MLALAVLHHLLVTNGVPLHDVLDFFAELSSGYVLLEYVDPADGHFKMLLRGRDTIHAYLTREYFEARVAERFEVLRSLEVKPGLRWIYLLKKQ